MSTTTITKCDLCQRERGPANHYWNMVIHSDQVGARYLVTRKWDKPIDGVDICGAECAGKAFQRFLATGKLEAE